MSQYKKKERKKNGNKKTAQAAHPQTFPALHPELDLQFNKTILQFDLTDIRWSQQQD